MSKENNSEKERGFLKYLKTKVSDFSIEGALSEERIREIDFIIDIAAYQFYEKQPYDLKESDFQEFRDKHNREKTLLDSFNRNALIEPMLRDLKIMSARVEHFRNESKRLLPKLTDIEHKQFTAKYNTWLNQTVAVLIIQLDELYNLINDEG